MSRRLTVVLSQAQGKDPRKRALEESVAAALIMEPGLDVSIVPSRRASTVRVAIAAIWARGWLTVVSGGGSQADIGRLSKPTTLKSPGICRCRSRAASYTPMA